MGLHCVVGNCQNNSAKKIAGIYFHKFPLTKKEKCEKWTAAVNRGDWKPTKYSYICSAHFVEKDYKPFYKDGLHALKDDAVPSRFESTQQVKNCYSNAETNYHPSKKAKNIFPETTTTVPQTVDIYQMKTTASILTHNSDKVEIETCNSTLPQNFDRAQTQTMESFNQSQCSTRLPTKQMFRRKIKTLREKVRRRNKKTRIVKELLMNMKEKTTQEVYDSLSIEKQALLEEIDNLRSQLKTQEQLHDSKVKDSETKIEDLIKQQKQEQENAKNQIEIEVEKNSKIFLIKLEEKDKEILSLKENFQKYQKGKEEAILKLQVEHAENLEKVKSHTPRNRPVFQHHDFKNNDIFRQKYMQLEKVHKDEVMQLKEQILKLQMVNKGLINRNESSLNVVQRSTPQNETPKQMTDFYTRKNVSNVITTVKPSEDFLEQTISKQNVCEQKDKDNNVKQNKLFCSELSDKPRKRKLFNPNLDYQRKKL